MASSSASPSRVRLRVYLQCVAGVPVNGDDVEIRTEKVYCLPPKAELQSRKTTLVESMLSEALRGSRQRLIGYTKIMLFHYRQKFWRLA